MLSSSSSSSSNELQPRHPGSEQSNYHHEPVGNQRKTARVEENRRFVAKNERPRCRRVGMDVHAGRHRKALSSTSPGLRFTRLDGTTPSHKRTQPVTTFNNGHGGSVFLLSRKAGGVGLNLNRRQSTRPFRLRLESGERFASNRAYPSRRTNEEHVHLPYIDSVHVGRENIPTPVSKGARC